VALVPGAGSRIAVNASPAIVVTSIFPPSPALREIAKERRRRLRASSSSAMRTAAEFRLQPCDTTISPPAKKRPAFSPSSVDAALCPEKHMAYLLAARAGAPLILETDDDNFPHPEFWRGDKCKQRRSSSFRRLGQNVYVISLTRTSGRAVFRWTQFTSSRRICSSSEEVPARSSTRTRGRQPDVDAIYRISSVASEISPEHQRCPSLRFVVPRRTSTTKLCAQAYPCSMRGA